MTAASGQTIRNTTASRSEDPTGPSSSTPVSAPTLPAPHPAAITTRCTLTVTPTSRNPTHYFIERAALSHRSPNNDVWNLPKGCHARSGGSGLRGRVERVGELVGRHPAEVNDREGD